MTGDVDRAVAVVRRGGLVVYPTETVYGLGADALDAEAVERVFAAKGRDPGAPVSLGVPSVDRALEFVRMGDRGRRFMREFLPGPVTVVARKRPVVPGVLTGGRERVGVRVPDHAVALGLLERVNPVTCTSANVSGQGSITRVDQLDQRILDAVEMVLDGGELPGVESTVVDPDRGIVHRRGALADEVEEWLYAN